MFFVMALFDSIIYEQHMSSFEYSEIESQLKCMVFWDQRYKTDFRH